VINDRLQKNFFDFVNGYRLKEVQTRLLAPEAEKLTILAVAFDSGFSSKSSFDTIFKMELPRFGGHPDTWVRRMFHAKVSHAVPARVPPPNGRVGAVRTYTG
jgi:AraC-like DNA-binding protein